MADRAQFQAMVLGSFEAAYRNIRMEQMPISELFDQYQAQPGSAEYPFWGDVYAAEEFRGVVDFIRVRDYQYSLKNKEWYTPGIEFLRADVERDRLSGLSRRIEGQTRAIMEVPAIETINALVNNGEAYDGKAFFSDVSAPRTFDNLLAGTGVTLAQITNDIDAARVAMVNFKTDTGRTLRRMPDTIVCPINLESTFRQIMNSTADPRAPNSGAANPWRNYIRQLIVSPELTDSNDWYYFHTMSPIKPLIWQYEVMRPSESPGERLLGGGRYRCEVDTTQLATARKYGTTCETRGVAGYGLPHFAIKVVNA